MARPDYSGFDAGPVTEASLADLSLALFSAYRQEIMNPGLIDEDHRTVSEQLGSLGFFDPQSGVPTAAGILMFGKNPRYFLPGAYIQFLRLGDTTLTEKPLDQAEISGDLLMILRETEARLKANIHTRMESVSLFREKLFPDYPIAAIRELLLNAILHRDYQSDTPIRLHWYADRIEIRGPGGLYGDVAADTLKRFSNYRNPIIAECLKALGYVNRCGTDIQKAEDLLRKNGNPPPEFEVTDRFFQVMVRGFYSQEMKNDAFRR